MMKYKPISTAPVWLAAIAIAAAIVSVAPTPGMAFDHAGLARRALEQHILPGYQRLAAAADRQSQTIATMCNNPGDQSITAAREAFRDALMAWGGIEHIRFGPITDRNRVDAMIFWPDPRGIARRQIERVLALQEPLSARTLADKSVAVQGFSALDIVLFGSHSETLGSRETRDRFRCGYARALAANIAAIANEALSGWTDVSGFAARWLHPGPDNPSFLNAKETTHALVQAYLTGLKQVRNARIGGVIGLKQQGVRALDPIVPNSGLALGLIIANVEGLRALLSESGLADAATDTPAAGSIVRSIAVELDLTIAKLRQVADTPGPFRPEVARGQLMALGWPLRNAHDSLSAAVADAAGLSIGFNSLDGD